VWVGVGVVLLSMVAGEEAELTVAAAEYGFGPEENARRGLGGDGARLRVRATLNSFDGGRDTWDMPVDEKLALCVQYRDQGNAFFKTQQYRRASRQYKEVCACLCVCVCVCVCVRWDRLMRACGCVCRLLSCSVMTRR
jgi:hypothetical protein